MAERGKAKASATLAANLAIGPGIAHNATKARAKGKEDTRARAKDSHGPTPQITEKVDTKEFAENAALRVIKPMSARKVDLSLLLPRR